jgi:mannose-6-phosphate isomerase-like protein (cupin superfamily)
MSKERINEYRAGSSDKRPWGTWRVIASREGYVVKEIVVNPGEILSLQSHEHRSEHWIVMSGIAEITVDDDVFIRKTNETAFIPAQSKHRIANKGLTPMIFVEVQAGDILSESDIKRYEDKYGR